MFKSWYLLVIMRDKYKILKKKKKDYIGFFWYKKMIILLKCFKIEKIFFKLYYANVGNII